MTSAEEPAPARRLKKNAKDALWVAGGNYFALLAGLPLGFITPAFLSPALYGVTAVIDAVTELLKSFHLGTLNALEREIPLLRTRGEVRRAEDVRDGVWTIILVLGVLVVVGPVVVARWVYREPPEFQICLGLACAAVVLYKLTGVHSALLKSEKRFGDDSRNGMIVAAAALVTLPVCLWALGLTGYFLSNAILPALSLALAALATGERPRIRIARGIPWLVLSFGLPVILVDFIGSAMSNIDRLVLQSIWDKPTLGLYFFAHKFNRYVLAVPSAVGQVMQRNMLGKLATAKDERDIADSVLVPAKLLAWTTSFFVGGVALAGPDAIEALYPRYAGVADPMRIFLLGAYWPGVAQMSSKHLQGVRRLWSPILAYLLAIGFILVGFLLIGGEITLVQAAVVASVGLAVKSFALIFQSLFVLSRTPGDIVARFCRFLPPFFVLIGLVFGLRQGWALWIQPVWSVAPFAAGLIQAVVFALLCSPCLLYLQRKHPLWESATASERPSGSAG